MQAVELATSHLDSHNDSAVCDGVATGIANPGKSGREDGSYGDSAWVGDECPPAHSNSINVDEHDREMQRMLVTEKMLQADLMNMGLVVDDQSSFCTTSGTAAAATPCARNGAPHKHKIQEDLWARDMSGSFCSNSRNEHYPLSHGQDLHTGVRRTCYTQPDVKRTASLLPRSAGRRPQKPPNRARPRSGRSEHRSPHAQSRTAASPAPIPRVAFLASPPHQSRAQHNRKHFPLVGGLQSELDNDEAYVILENTLKRTGRIGPGREQDVYTRQVAWRAKVEAKAQTMRREMHEEEVSNCTFRPHSAKRSKSHPPNMSQDAAMEPQRNCGSHPLWDVHTKPSGSLESAHAMLATHFTTTPAGDTEVSGANEQNSGPCYVTPGHRLYAKAQEKAQKLDDQRKAFRIEQEKEWRQRPARRLSPQVYPAGCLLGSVSRPVARENLRAWEHMWNPDVNPTFRPTTNFGSQMRRNTRRRAKSMGAVPDRSGTGMQTSRTWKVPCSGELDFREFLTRQALHGTRRAARIKEIQHEFNQSLARTVPMAPGTRRMLSQGTTQGSHARGLV
eukprot:jgi/Ulvmu1/8922/UM005_0013.1